MRMLVALLRLCTATVSIMAIEGQKGQVARTAVRVAAALARAMVMEEVRPCIRWSLGNLAFVPMVNILLAASMEESYNCGKLDTS